MQFQSQTFENILYVGFQFIHRTVFICMCPRVWYHLTGYPQAQMVVFWIRSQYLFRILLFCIKMVTITEFKEFQVGILTICIVSNAFQATEQQCLTHAIQVCTQRIQQHHQILGSISFHTIVIGCPSQRVIQYFVETATNQLFGYQIL